MLIKFINVFLMIYKYPYKTSPKHISGSSQTKKTQATTINMYVILLYLQVQNIIQADILPEEEKTSNNNEKVS